MRPSSATPIKEVSCRIRPAQIIKCRAGLTVAELLVVTSILGLLLSSLCGIYIAMVNEWQRQQGQGDSLVALSRALEAVSADVSQAITADCVNHYGPQRAIVYTLPLDRDPTNEYYVPAWVGGSLQYRPGEQKAFYLSDTSGAWNQPGQILWRGIVTGEYPFSYQVIPDPTWDAHGQRGRIPPIDSLYFDLDNWGHPKRVSMTATVSYKVMSSTTQMTRVRDICLRNAN